MSERENTENSTGSPSDEKSKDESGNPVAGFLRHIGNLRAGRVSEELAAEHLKPGLREAVTGERYVPPSHEIENELTGYALVNGSGHVIRMSNDLDRVTYLGSRIAKKGWKIVWFRAAIIEDEVIMTHGQDESGTVVTGGAPPADGG